MSKIYLNTRYYKYIGDSDDNIIELRVIGFNNSETCKCKITKGPETDIGKIIKIPISVLKEDYTLLIPDGNIIFNIVKVQQGLDDVMVTVIPKEKMDIGYAIPTVICRQCVVDLFAKQFANQESKEYVGLSISEETCPADVEFTNFLVCESILHSTICNYYIGDTLDYLLSLFSHKKYDDVLSGLLSDYCNNLKTTMYAGLADYYLRKGEGHGFVNNLTSLLKLNNFEYDLYRAFHIIPTTLNPQHFDDGVLSKHAEYVLSSILRVGITKSLVVKYDKDIDLKSIAKKYALVSDNEGTVYVVAYFSNGSYEVTENGKFTETPEQIKEAYENIRFNISKYKK